jgi:hypothetical protein
VELGVVVLEDEPLLPHDAMASTASSASPLRGRPKGIVRKGSSAR